MAINQDDVNRQMTRLFGASERILVDLEGRVEREIIRAYQDTLKSIRADVAELYAKIGDSEPTLIQANKLNRLARLETEVAEHLTEMGKTARTTVKESIEDQFSEAFYHSAYATETPLNVDLGFGGLARDQVRAAALNPLDRIKWPKRLANNINGLNDQVRQTLTTGFAQGHGFGKMAQNLKDDLERSLADTTRILRTEGQRAKSVGRKLAHDEGLKKADALGLDMERVWDATLDTRTRFSHQALDQKPADEEGQWTFPDGTTTEGPGLSGVGSHDIHCRCTTRIQVKGQPPEVRRDQEAREFVPYTDYKTWAENRKIPTKTKSKRFPRDPKGRKYPDPKAVRRQVLKTDEKFAALDAANEKEIRDAFNLHANKVNPLVSDFQQIPLQDIDGPEGLRLSKAIEQENKRHWDTVKPLQAKRQEIHRQRTQELRDLVYVDKDGFDIPATIGTKSPKIRATALEGKKEFSKMIDPRIFDDADTPLPLKIKATRSHRAFWSNGDFSVYLNSGHSGTRTAIHEFVHWTESRNKVFLEAERAFYLKRTKGEASKWLGRGYGRHEITKVDKFMDKYMGKDYSGGSGHFELMSMGLDTMWADPVALAKADPEMFDWVYKMARGQFGDL